MTTMLGTGPASSPHASPRSRRFLCVLLASMPGAVFAQAAAETEAAPPDAVASSDAEMAAANRSSSRSGFSVSQTPSQALALPQSTLATPGLGPPSGFQATTQTMVWSHADRLAVGVGVEQRWQGQDALQLQRLQGTPPVRDASMLVGVSLPTGERSRLTWQAPLVRSDALPGTVVPERQMSVGLDFHVRDPYSDLRRGSLMKVELSGPMVLSLKPRNGRLAVMLSSKW